MLGADVARIIVMGVMVVAWGVINGVLLARDSSKNKKLIEGVAGKAGEGDGGEEGAILKQRLDEALKHLRRLRGVKGRGKKYLYELPWYILIGPPGSGK